MYVGQISSSDNICLPPGPGSNKNTKARDLKEGTIRAKVINKKTSIFLSKKKKTSILKVH